MSVPRRESSDVSIKKVKAASANPLGELEGVLIEPSTAAPRPGLILVHEWWGMNENIQATAAEVAREGNFTVLVLDMYRGKVAKDREEAGHYMGKLDWTGAILDISGGANYLKQQGCKKVGITGFCMGGALSFAAAVMCPEISAAAPFYGIPKSELVDLTKISVTVQAHFAEKDEVVGFSSPADYKPLSEKLAAAKVPYELCTYDAGHAFSNPASPGFNNEAKQLAFSRLYSFMGKHLS